MNIYGCARRENIVHSCKRTISHLRYQKKASLSKVSSKKSILQPSPLGLIVVLYPITSVYPSPACGSIKGYNAYKG